MRPSLVELLSLDVETSKKYPPAQPASSRLQGVQLTPPQEEGRYGKDKTLEDYYIYQDQTLWLI